MSAGGAYFGSLGTNNEVTAVTAFPNLNGALLENFSSFNVLQESAISFLMVLFDSSNHTELLSEVVEAFFFSGLCKTVVHIGPLIVFAFSSRAEVLSGIAKAVQFLEPKLSVFFFVISSLEEEGSDLLIAFLLCNGCKIGVLVSSLGLACESSFKVLFGLGALGHMRTSCAMPA